jgi:hypothetical protein
MNVTNIFLNLIVDFNYPKLLFYLD